MATSACRVGEKGCVAPPSPVVGILADLWTRSEEPMDFQAFFARRRSCSRLVFGLALSLSGGWWRALIWSPRNLPTRRGPV